MGKYYFAKQNKSLDVRCLLRVFLPLLHKEVQVGKDQEKAKSKKDFHSKTRGGKNQTNNQDPVVQSIVSLTISLRHKFVKQISAKVTNTLLFFVEKM